MDPLVTDVTEDKYVYVDRSGFGGDISGEGLFAKAEIHSGTVFAYFGGNRSESHCSTVETAYKVTGYKVKSLIK